MKMKKMLFFFVLTLSLFSQTLDPPVTAEISSDFGPRNLGSSYNWHKGIDYPVGRGTEVQAVEGGEIREISYESHGPGEIRGGWHIRIGGSLATWCYLHLFSDNSNPISGNWEVRMATLENPDDSAQTSNRHIFILWNDRNNNRAEEILTQYSQEIPSWYVRARPEDPGYDSLNPYILNESGNGRVLTHGSVGTGDAIALSGNSGGAPYHLDIRCSSPTAPERAYDINPLYHIKHDSTPNYTFDIRQPAADAHFFHLPGKSESQQENERIQVLINSINGKDLDRACVYFFDPDSARFYVDSTRYAMICYGGLPQNPDSTDADTTVPFPREITYGNWRGTKSRSGVDPQGDDPSIDDFWYIGGFSQDTFHFNSKINKAETKDAILNKWAASDVKKAKFKDGWIDMVIRARKVRQKIVDSTERRILLDNFVPYVYDVFVTRENEVVYNAMWLLNSIEDSLDFNEKISKNVLPGETLKFKIYFSEKMDTTTIKVKLQKEGKELEIKDNEEWIDKMT